MILDLDCGNTLIKWRVGEKARGHACSVAELTAQLRPLQLGLRHCRIASVRSHAETCEIEDELRREYPILQIHMAMVLDSCAGVSNGYREAGRLGLDRWLAMLAAYHLAGKACLVIDLGTAITADFIDACGKHLGGYICPGLPLLRAQLRTHTRRVRYEDQEAARATQELLPGRCTAEAVERGCLMMVQGAVTAQLHQAHQLWGSNFTLFLTGGDAVLVEGLSPVALHVPDLVFIGLGLACPLEE